MITILGDIHGNQRSHKRVMDSKEYALQIGDCGFNYKYLEDYDPLKHQLFFGNHDNYDWDCNDLTHCLGEFGLRKLNDAEFFFVRGGFSIDWTFRVSRDAITRQKSWWSQEQLSLKQCEQCLKEYVEAAPKVLISHSVPRSIAAKIGNSDVLKHYGYDPATFTTNTQELLQTMIEAHPPEIMIMGHMHKSYRINNGRTQFVGLDIGETYDLEER